MFISIGNKKQPVPINPFIIAEPNHLHSVAEWQPTGGIEHNQEEKDHSLNQHLSSANQTNVEDNQMIN
jgi:hypothetical protein